MLKDITQSNHRLPPHKVDSFVETLGDLDSSHTSWQVTDTVSLNFDTHHPQGLVKIGEEYFLSSVERKLFRGGKGHLFKFNQEGQLLDKITLGDKKRYHPGGIDFDGESLWVSVAEYKPSSSTTVYKVDPKTLDSEEVFSVNDHVGAITVDRETGHLHGATWDSERLLEWESSGKLLAERENQNRRVNYQDWKYVGQDLALASGVKAGGGGIELISLDGGPPEAQISISNRSRKGRPLTQNPMTFRFDQEQLQLFFIPDDKTSELYTLEPERETR